MQSLTIFIFSQKCLFLSKILKILMDLNGLYHTSPMELNPASMEIQNFVHFPLLAKLQDEPMVAAKPG